jgi:hypothetical protein
LWPMGNSNPGPHGIHVKWNGREIIATAVDSYPPGFVEVGANSIGASSSVSNFDGDVLYAGPVDEENL